MPNRADKSYWYCFVFVGKSISTGLDTTANTKIGFHAKIGTELLTEPEIEKLKGYAGLTKEAALTNILYLGYGTREEFKGEKEGD